MGGSKGLSEPVPAPPSLPVHQTRFLVITQHLPLMGPALHLNPHSPPVQAACLDVGSSELTQVPPANDAVSIHIHDVEDAMGQDTGVAEVMLQACVRGRGASGAPVTGGVLGEDGICRQHMHAEDQVPDPAML